MKGSSCSSAWRSLIGRGTTMPLAKCRSARSTEGGGWSRAMSAARGRPSNQRYLPYWESKRRPSLRAKDARSTLVRGKVAASKAAPSPGGRTHDSTSTLSSAGAAEASAGQARNPATDTTSTFDRDLRAGITASRALVIEGTGAQGSKTRTAAHHSAQGENTQDLRRAALAMQLVRS